MREDYKTLLKPEIVDTVKGLSLISKLIVEGYLSGFNRSRRVGEGLEFSQYRGYEPGDDLRLLDWKMVARSGKYFVKQAEIDTHIQVNFVVDTSKSMLHTEGELSKSSLANILIACLGHLAHQQGDAIGTLTINDNKINVVPPSVGNLQFKKFLYSLLEISNEGMWPQPKTIKIPSNKSDKEIVFVFTDLYENKGEIVDTIQSLKTPHNEITVIHLMGSQELQFSYNGAVVFEDLETGKKINVQSQEYKANYLSDLHNNIARVKSELLANNVGYELVLLDDHIGQRLQSILKKRSAFK